MKKRITVFCVTLLAVAVALLYPVAALGQEKTQFTDIEGWYKPYILDLTDKSILEGRTATTFCPEEEITRAEFLTILARLSGDDINPYKSAVPSFNDISTAAWYLPYVEWGYANKVVVGYQDGSFLPNENIKRQDIAVMLSRYARRVVGVTLPDKGMAVDFSDADSTGFYAREAVSSLSKAGILEGYSEGTFRPLNPILRGEVAKIISVFLGDMPGYESIGYTWRDLTYLIHAGGIVNGQYFTNTVESFDNCVRHGQSFIEVDFCWTSDGELVCLRNWGYVHPGGQPLTLKEFMNMKIFNGHTPASIDTLAQWLRDNPGEYIITDVKDDNVKAMQVIAGRYPDLLNRFIPQIYGEAEYNAVAKMGFKDIILTTYKMEPQYVENPDNLIAFSQNHDIIGITLGEYYAKNIQYVAKLRRSGVLLGVYTVNNVGEINNYLSGGINMIYTDRVDLQ